MSAGKPASSKQSPSSRTAPLSVKQQRAADRERKLAEFRAKEARAKRNRTIWIVAGVAAAAVAITLLIVSIVVAPKPTSYTAGSAGAEITGVETFENDAGHVDTPVDYPQTPPAGGEHNPAWLNCGVYDQAVPNENAVHALEHGAVWVTYDPSLADDQLATLKSKLPTTYVVLSPFDGLPSPIVLSAWNAQLQLDDAGDERVGQFFEEYWRSDLAPEPGAPCTGGIDAPGKVS